MGDKDVILNEVKMLQALEGVPGIPKLVEYWLIEMAPDEVDDTQMYRQKIYSSTAGMYCTHVHLVLKTRARPLHEFRSRKELVKAIRDIVLNWEFAARITSDDLYTAGGTGTIPFMSIDVLEAMGTLEYQQSQTAAEDQRKATNSSVCQEVPKLKHTYHNDLESVFYVFAWELVPLAEEWAEIIKQKDMKMEFDDISSSLDKHLAKLLDNEISLDFQTSSSRLAKRMGKEEKDLVTPKRNKIV
ncbi:hypothetical protein BD769DRAFT_1681406 [Suillus cothurnatus]|nr:hypothetical protein BD769DRAFT_1681406 [Suillus cothurnatus]